jgi:hypothetical protein
VGDKHWPVSILVLKKPLEDAGRGQGYYEFLDPYSEVQEKARKELF